MTTKQQVFLHLSSSTIAAIFSRKVRNLHHCSKGLDQSCNHITQGKKIFHITDKSEKVNAYFFVYVWGGGEEERMKFITCTISRLDRTVKLRYNVIQGKPRYPEISGKVLNKKNEKTHKIQFKNHRIYLEK